MPNNSRRADVREPSPAAICSIGEPKDFMTFDGLAFSPDGSVIAVVMHPEERQRHLRLFDAKTLKCLRDEAFEYVEVNGILYPSKAQVLLCCDDDGIIELRLEESRCRKVLRPLADQARSRGTPCLLPRSGCLAVPTRDGVQFWSSDPLGFRSTLSRGEATCVAADSDESLLAIGRETGRVEVWDIHARKMLGVCEGHFGGIKRLSFQNGAPFLASASTDDCTVRVWQARKRYEEVALLEQTSSPSFLEFSPDGRFLAVGDHSECVLYDTINWDKVDQITAGPFCFSPRGPVLAYVAPDYASLAVCTIPRKRAIKASSPRRSESEILLFSPDNSALACSDAAGSVGVWDPTSGTCLLNDTLDARARELVFSSDSRLLIAAGEGRCNIATWQRGRRTFTKVGVRPARLDREALRGDRSSRDGALGIADWATARGGQVHARIVDVSGTDRDGKLIPESRLIHFWTGQEPALVLTERNHEPQCVVFSRDGNVLASGGSDGDIVLWDAITGKAYHRFRSHPGPLTSLAFAQDGRFLACGNWCGCIVVWDLEQTVIAHTEALIRNERRAGVWSSEDEDRRDEVMKHMTAREKELAAPCLVASLRDTGEYIRKRAARALGAMGQPCLGKAVDELIRLVREDAASRREAIEALRAVRPLPRQAMTALIEALGDQTDACDLEISEVLLGQPRLTTKAVQALGRILHHGSRIRARKTAANALAGAGDPSLDQLLGALGDPQCGWIAAIGLASAGRRSAKKVAGLLSDSTALVRRNAIRCLDLIGSPSESIRTELARLTEDIDVGVRLAAKKALRHSPARRGSPSAGRTTVRNESVATRVLPG